MPASSNSLVRAILLTGFIAGSMDITGACISAYLNSGLAPIVVLHYVASGVLGKAAFTGGAATAVFGLAVHYFIAYSWTVFFFLLYPRLSFLSSNKYIVGILYGAFVWIIMNLVILKLADMGSGAPFNIVKAATGMFILMICIGLPISIGAHQHYRK